ncbi:hypothetical protein X801_10599 [Opisthorchis viverrini]|uniref:Cleavage and polyadenylation specificity factor subunit 4 n=1 Tax=Opisthorchis viverrini TaxID=6198 RepID=A0A1S8WGR2_OPIVI|nr:hypothetical protein X801_10599 [Opisthorchis viverrini]
MDNLIADVSDIDFVIETQLDKQIGLGCLPFSNMNKSGAGVCKFFIINQCTLSNLCPLRHIKADRTVVCKHWLRGLCKKGDDCEFLHEYDMTKMPECYFFSKFGECMNKECPFLHIDPASKVPCAATGMSAELPVKTILTACACWERIVNTLSESVDKIRTNFVLVLSGGLSQEAIRTHKRIGGFVITAVSERGHKIQFCLKLPPEERLRLQEQQRAQNMGNAVGGAGAGQAGQALGGRFQSERLKYGGLMNFTQTATAATGPRQGPQKPLDEVTCFKCGEKGHYANRCNKGYLAFLSKVSLQQNDGDGARG